MTSPYASFSDTLRDNGYHVMPVMPGAKVPGSFNGAGWQPMSQWSKWCDAMPPDFLHQKWSDWPDAGLCVAHGAVVGLDIDTDRKDVADAAVAAVGPSPLRRTGQKGWMGYYRPGASLDDQTARVRWYDADGKICVELLLHGTQSVIPPTIHPGTGKPYRWITPESMDDVAASDLPELPFGAVGLLDHAFKPLGLTRKAPRKVNATEYDRPAPTANDLEKPIGRSINDRAMEPDAIDRWWPALNLPKSRQRGRSGSWEAVPFWRSSGSGRAMQDRNPNLKAIPTGIIDFGADRSYTPIDVVMAARDCSYGSATDWLTQFIRQEDIVDFSGIAAPQGNAESQTAEPQEKNFAPEPPERPNLDRWAATPIFTGKRSYTAIKTIAMPSDAEFDALLPRDVPPFPIQGFDAIDGLLGEVARHIDAASATQTEAGALAVALPLLGSAMGRAYATPSNLRTNIYTVALGGSGTGKTSLVGPAKELMRMGQIADQIGQDRIASGSGLIQMLTANPRRVCFLDEFGHMLQQLGSAGAGIHARQIITEFTALYSAAWTMFTGTAYATREPTPIDCPHLCIFGMATPEQFWRAFGSSALEDGSVARYLVFPIGQTGAKDPDERLAEETAKGIRSLQSAIASQIRGNMGTPEVKRVPIDDYAEKSRLALKDKEAAFAEYAERNAIRGGPAILRRVTENALKIALISAVGRNPRDPEIDARDMDIGHAIAWWSANVMISNIASFIADNQTERDVNEVERFVMEGGDLGRDWRDVQRRFRRIRARDLKEIVEALEKEGSILAEMVSSNTGGHPRKILSRVSQNDRDT